MAYLKIILLCFGTLLFHLQLHGLEVITRGIQNQAVFGIEFPGNARSYHAREASVQSISKQEYVTAAFRVLEVNVVTSGPALLRIYHSRPLGPAELSDAVRDTAEAAGLPSSILRPRVPAQMDAAADRTAEAAEALTGQTVVKEYPLATHAHTIEFRVASRSELLALHQALKQHWLQEPAFFEDGQIVADGESTQSERRPRNLGGTLFRVEGR